MKRVVYVVVWLVFGFYKIFTRISFVFMMSGVYGGLYFVYCMMVFFLCVS